jgi:two-component system chemotaxis response regulator CheB
VEEPIRYSRPSIDLTFTSAADAFGGRTIGVVLTGANADGAAGLKRIAERGGAAIIQEPVTAESPTMPSAALDAVPKARVMVLSQIGSAIAELASMPDSRRFTRDHRAPEARP